MTLDDRLEAPPAEQLSPALLAFAILLPSAVTWLYFVALADAPAWMQQSAYVVGKAIQFGLPMTWLVAARPWARIEWRAPRGIGFGIAFGLTLLVATWCLYALLLKPMGFFEGPAAAAREKVAGMGLASARAYVALGVFYSLLHSFLEEYYWRWFVFGELCRPMPLGAGIALSSVGFALHHVLVLATYFGWDSPATYLFSLCVAIGGAVWAWLYRASGSLVGPWISHALVDAAIFLVGYDLCRDLLG
jgi:membrane protease YdiL (CAAX protease family)